MSLFLSFRRFCITIISISILLGSLFNTKSFGIGSIFSNNNIFVESAVTGNVTVCVNNDEKLMDVATCKDRLHTNLDVFHGERDFHYIFRKKDEQNKGLYVIITTSETNVIYKLDYKVSVPLFYKEHTDPVTYKEAGRDSLMNVCSRVTNNKCVKKHQLPPGLEETTGVCCICNINLKGPTVRGNYACEIEEPWYRLYKAIYPPTYKRSVGIKIFKFDSSKGLIPNLNLDKDGKFDNVVYPNPKKEVKKPLLEEKKEELTTSQAIPEEKSLKPKDDVDMPTKIVDPNFRNIKLDQKIKEERIDGSAPHMINDFIAIPSFPRTNETVKGSSLADKCNDSTWDESVKCPSYLKKKLCDPWRCTVNMRTVNPEAVDTTGSTCDKIGVSIQTWGNHRRLCHTQNGSCIKRQLYWYFEQEKEKAKLPVLYGTEPILTIGKIDQSIPSSKDVTKTTWYDDNRIHFLNYVHNQDDVTRLKIDTFDGTVTEIISEFPGFIISSKIDEECKSDSSKMCNLQTEVKNMGMKKSDFTIRASCFSKGVERIEKNVIASIDETTLGIDANEVGNFSVPISLSGADISGEGTCDVVLYSSLKAVLDRFVVPIKITETAPSYGKDPLNLDPKIFTEPDKANIVVTPPPENEKNVVDKPVGSKSDDSECKCAKWNIFCMLFNFKKCILSKLSKVYMYIVIALGILLGILLLPIIIPLLIFLFKRIFILFKMPYEAAQRRKFAKMNKMEIINDMNATQNVDSELIIQNKVVPNEI